MARWSRLGMMALILLAVWGFGMSSSLQAQVVASTGPAQIYQSR